MIYELNREIMKVEYKYLKKDIIKYMINKLINNINNMMILIKLINQLFKLNNKKF